MRLSAVAPGGPRAGDSGLSGQVLQRRQAVAGVADGRPIRCDLCREPTHPQLHHCEAECPHQQVSVCFIHLYKNVDVTIGVSSAA